MAGRFYRYIAVNLYVPLFVQTEIAKPEEAVPPVQ